ncbi:MAG: bifunctional diguanylate cyclase/phosphodiesterase [Actinomycetota bacterium]|nr:bifunctional diguanylate cyclase/phosphodiesterase [Actinomycetota bacterium]
MSGSHLSRPARRAGFYLAGVSSAGWLLLLFVALKGGLGVERRPAELLVLIALVICGELAPIKVGRHSDVYELTTSTTFSFAIMLSWGFPTALLAQAVGSLCADLLQRKPWWKTLFNAAQYGLSLGAGALLLSAFTDLPSSEPGINVHDLGGVLASIVGIFVTNELLVTLAMALHSRERTLSYLKRELSLLSLGNGMLLMMSPVLVVLSDISYLFALFILIPLGTMSAVSLQNAKLVGRLKQQAEQSEYQASHDSLTGLPNRMVLRDRVEQAVLAAERDGLSAAVMIMDLDSFKEVNDSLGHHAGDLLLQQIAKRLRSALRDSDTVARLGGDEFAVLLPRLTDPIDASTTAKKLLESLHAPFNLEGLDLEIGASIGIAVYPTNGTDGEILFQRADVAMYAAKERRAGHETYAAEHDTYDPSRLTLVPELRRALDLKELDLYFQPQANMRTRRIRGVEALLRWHHPQRGVLTPDHFIPLAEHTGLIRPMTSYVLEEALRQCSEWQDQGLGLYVSVNLSAQSLLDLNFPDQIAELLQRWDVPPQWLKLELTEGTLMGDPVRALRVLTKLSAMRVSLAIDDFGTGYSSFAYLKRLPVSSIKIDKSFVMNMLVDESDEVIVRSLIDLGRNLGVETVAEGVESEEVWNRLVRLGCDTAQGYLSGRPVCAADITARLLEENRLLPSA